MPKSISQLETQAIPHDTDLFEVASVDSNSASGYKSGKMSAEVIAEGMLNNFTYPTAMPDMQNKTITGAINQMLANFAPVYDATATYSKDDVVTYNGQLYKANQDISVAEAWDSTHWTAIVVKQISGANQHNYSTTEQEVGTWFGETLYERTFDCGQLGYNTTVNYNHGITDISRIVEFNGLIYDASNPTSINSLPVINGASDYIRCGADATKIWFKCQDSWSSYNALVTLRYTKTTP